MTAIPCPSCSASIDDPARFCPNCGTPLDGDRQEVRKTVTIVFCDLSESTRMSEQVDAESLRAIMLRYFELMRSCLVRHGGTVEKYIGDAVMGVFGVPQVREDDALRAVRAAADMCAAITRLDAEMTRDSGIGIAIRVGVNTGEVVAVDGATGGQTFVSGEAVNMAARLEQHAPTGAALLGDPTYRLVSGAVEADAVPPLAVKGRSRPLPAWRLRVVRADAAPVRRRFDTPLLGRHHEMRQLALLLDGVRQDRTSHLCTVFADPGIGKSRLAHEFIMAARRSGALTAAGGCSAYSGGTLAPFDTVLSTLLAASGPDGTATADPAIAAGLAGVLCDGTPGIAVEETFWAVRAAITAVARERPVVLVLDDLQWASPTALDLITDLTDRLQGVPVLLVCLARFELLDARPHWGGGHLGTTSIVLPPLTTDDTHRLIESLTEVSPHQAGTEAEDIAATAGGNPFFIEQLQAMRHEDREYGLPSTVQAVVAARLDLLPPPHLEWLRWAALFGEQFTTTGIHTVAPEAGLTDDDLRRLTLRRFIEPHAAGQDAVVYRFTSTQIRDVAYAALPKRVRAERHMRIARSLAGRPDGDEVVGRHLESAARYQAELGEPGLTALAQEAGEYLSRAGHTAFALGDVCRARSLFERALALAPGQAPTMAALADVLVAAGEFDAADRLFAELETPAGDGRLASHARLQRSVLGLGDEGPDHLTEVIAEVLPVFHAAGDRLGMARCRMRLGQVSQVHSHFDAAREEFERALDLARGTNARMELATTLGGLAYCLWRGTEPTGAALRRCTELASHYHDLPTAALVAVDCPRALLLAMRREFDEGRAILTGARRTLADLGHVTAAATVPIFAGNLELLADDPAAAEDAFRTARAAFDEIGDTAMRDAATVDLARAVVQLGRHAEAGALLDACTNLGGPMLRAETALAASLGARILAISGEPAPGPLATARVLLGEMQSPQCEGTILLDIAHAHFGTGKREEGVAAIRRARDRFAAKDDLVGRAQAESMLVEVADE